MLLPVCDRQLPWELQSDKVFTRMKADSEAQIFNSVSCCFISQSPALPGQPIWEKGRMPFPGAVPSTCANCVSSQPNLVQRSPVPQGFPTLQLLHQVSNPLHPPGLKVTSAFCRVTVCACRAQWIPNTHWSPDPPCIPHPSSPPPPFPAGLCLLRAISVHLLAIPCSKITAGTGCDTFLLLPILSAP